MNLSLKKTTALLCLATLLAPVVLGAEVLPQPSGSSRFSFADSFRVGSCHGPELPAFACSFRATDYPSPTDQPKVPDLKAALRLAAQQPGESPPELRQIHEEESEYGRKRAAALAKIGTGTVLASVSIAAALGLAALGYDKNEEEEKKGVPDNEREASYYYLGALVVGVAGGSWGLSVRRHGKAELSALEAEKISFGIDSEGNPRIALTLSLP